MTPAAPPASPPASCYLATPGEGPKRKPSLPSPPGPGSPPTALCAMDAPEQQPDPDGYEPGGSPQDELDFSMLFNYDYLNPIEGP